jgi:hypothetical protein
MTKAEMEVHRAQYYELIAKARAARQEGLYREAVELAMSSWNYIDGMMQYERKYEDKEFGSIEGIDMVLKYAPMLFDRESLDKLEVVLKNQRRIERDTSADMANKLAEARMLMWDARRMWDYLEQHPQSRQDELRVVLGGNQEQWRGMAEAWDQMGLLCRRPDGGSYRLTLVTGPEDVLRGKCPSCGLVARAPRSRLLSEVVCPNCHKAVSFVVLCKEALAKKEE